VHVGPYALPAAGARSGKVLVGLRPEDFAPAANGATDGVLPARVEIVEQLGPEVLVYFHADGLPDTLVARLDAGFQAARGDLARLRVEHERMRLFDPETGVAL